MHEIGRGVEERSDHLDWFEYDTPLGVTIGLRKLATTRGFGGGAGWRLLERSKDVVGKGLGEKHLGRVNGGCVLRATAVEGDDGGR